MTRAAAFVLISALLPFGAVADATSDPALPPAGFGGERYSPLWTRSPFAIATPEVSASADYQLVGLAQFDGVSYATLIVKQTQEHFVLTSNAPVKDLKLISISHDGPAGSAIIERGGERLVLQEEAAPSAPVTAASSYVAPVPAPGTILPPNRSFQRMHARFHRPVIVVPPRPTNSD